MKLGITCGKKTVKNTTATAAQKKTRLVVLCLTQEDFLK